MKKQRRTFSPEFKHDAASLVLDQGYGLAEAGRVVNVHENTLRKWVHHVVDNKTKNSLKNIDLYTTFFTREKFKNFPI